MKKWFWIHRTSVIALSENSAYKITPLEGKNTDGPLKNAQLGFNCIFFHLRVLLVPFVAFEKSHGVWDKCPVNEGLWWSRFWGSLETWSVWTWNHFTSSYNSAGNDCIKWSKIYNDTALMKRIREEAERKPKTKNNSPTETYKAAMALDYLEEFKRKWPQVTISE